MKEHYFDDLKVGDRFKSEPLEVTVKQVIEFAHKFDPQMFHLSRKSAERTIFKGLVASGWHTAAMTMRLFVQTLNYGIIRLRNVTTNQRSEIVQTMTANVMVPRRKVSD